MAKKKELTKVQEIIKELKLNKNQAAAIAEYEAKGGNLDNLIKRRTIYQIGNNLSSKELIRLYFKEV